MSGVWILLLLLVTGCDSHVFEVGDCVDIPRFRESWEEVEKNPYKILEIGERNYRVRFVKYLLNGGDYDHSLSFFDAAAIYEKVECPQ